MKDLEERVRLVHKSSGNSTPARAGPVLSSVRVLVLPLLAAAWQVETDLLLLDMAVLMVERLERWFDWFGLGGGDEFRSFGFDVVTNAIKGAPGVHEDVVSMG